jgi:phage tail sheath protein FI
MTSDDLLNGFMRVTIKVAVTHPAEFIVIEFEQQMAKSS